MKHLASILLPAACLVIAGCSSPDPATPQGRRQINFELLGKTNKALSSELEATSPNLDTVRSRAKELNALSQKLESWFPAGSGPDGKIDTDALPDVWTKPQDFHAAAAKLIDAAAKLDQAATAGDLAGVKVHAAAAGAACKDCHAKFKD